MVLKRTDLKKPTIKTITIPIKTYDDFKKIVCRDDTTSVDVEIIKMLNWRIRQLKKMKQTRAVNSANRVVYGRPPRVVSIKLLRRLRKQGLTQEEIGIKVGLGRTTVCRRLNSI